MKFIEFLQEDSKLKDSLENFDFDKLFIKVKQSAADNNISLYETSAYYIGIQKNILTGVFIYTLNGPDERYKSTKYELPEEDYFYIGEFKYDEISKRVTDISESTVNRYMSSEDAEEYIVETLHGIKL
jgi:hypothetical protein